MAAAWLNQLRTAVGAGQTQMSERADSRVVDDAGVVQHFLELGSSTSTLPGLEVGRCHTGRAGSGLGDRRAGTGKDL